MPISALAAPGLALRASAQFGVPPRARPRGSPGRCPGERHGEHLTGGPAARRPTVFCVPVLRLLPALWQTSTCSSVPSAPPRPSPLFRPGLSLQTMTAPSSNETDRRGCGGRTLQSTSSSTRRTSTNRSPLGSTWSRSPASSCHSWPAMTSPSSRRSSTAPRTGPTSKPWRQPGRSTCPRWLECSLASWEPATTESSTCCRSVDDRDLTEAALRIVTRARSGVRFSRPTTQSSQTSAACGYNGVELWRLERSRS